MVFFLFFSSLSAADNKHITITDLAGRKVQFTDIPQRIILGESRYLSALSIVAPQDPIKRVAGMLADLKAIDHGTYQLYRQKFPHIDHVPLVGHTSVDSLSVENVINLQADLAIFGVDGHGPSARHAELITQLEKAGVPILFIDFRNNPVTNTIKSIRLLGKVLDGEARAEAFISFYREQLARVSDGLQKAGKSPSVFIHSRAGLHDHCCETMVKGMMAGLLDYANGDNLAAAHIPGYAGTFNLEYLLVNQPDIYIATAVGGSEAKDSRDPQSLPYIHLGAGVSNARAQASFRQMIAKNGLQTLTAITRGKAYAIWHHFYNSPLNVVAIQVFATWLYPEIFADLDPQQTMAILFDRFQAIPLEGQYWLSLTIDSQGR
ncbi:MAG: ABC transporter substrate-binding protein [Cellvibrionaceae bacterium]|nr:ABC transporter substrate-binding protein [Cellvibrionaceae bacterium]